MNEDGSPVTRTQLREELARYPTREDLREELARFAPKDELGQLMRMLAQQHEAVLARFTWLSEELPREIARAARAAAEEHRRELGVLDDRYRDLPARSPRSSASSTRIGATAGSTRRRGGRVASADFAEGRRGVRPGRASGRGGRRR